VDLTLETWDALSTDERRQEAERLLRDPERARHALTLMGALFKLERAPNWTAKRVLELAPAYWKKTLELEEAQRRLTTPEGGRILTGAEVRPLWFSPSVPQEFRRAKQR
jgi:hypothetical protein